jgi:hypothetical protein
VDTVTLVENQIDDGERLVEQFVADGGSVTAAFWVKTAEEGQWFLYIATDAVDRDGPAAAYRAVYASLQKLPDLWVGMSEITLVGRDNPITKSVLTLLTRHPSRLPARFGRETLGNVSAEEVYIYPRKPVKVTIYGLVFRGDPSSALHLSFEPHNPHSKLTVDCREYQAETGIDWVVAAPEGSVLERDKDGTGQKKLAWNLYGNPRLSDANEVWSLAKLGLHGFRFLREPAGK